MTRIEKNCAACGDLITVRLADHKRGWGKFCNKQCAAAYKVGQRPRDINAYHAKCTKFGWAYDRYHDFQKLYPNGVPPKAPSVKEQVGKVKVRRAYHSPSMCRSCGASISGPGLCFDCHSHDVGMIDAEAGWDGHKVWLS
jgi:hypothetical protein